MSPTLPPIVPALMSPVRKGVCTRLVSEVDSRLAVIESLANALQGQIKALKKFCSSFSFSPGALIDAKIDELTAAASAMIPSLKQFDELVDIINACSFLASAGILGKPSALAKGILKALKGNAMGMIHDITANLPEFSGAALFEALFGALKTGGVKIIVPQIQQVLGCLSAICGMDINDRYDRLQAALNKLCLKGNGKFDMTKFLSGLGYDQTKIDNLVKCLNKQEEILFDIMDSVDDGVTYMKEAYDEFFEDDDEDVPDEKDLDWEL